MYYIAKMSDEEETDSIISDNESIDYTSENDDEPSDDLEDENNP